MPKLYIMKGLPACGKTTYIKNNLSHAVRVNRDSLRWMIYGSAWNPKRERDVTIAEHGCVVRALADHKDVVVDATNLNSRSMEQWEAIAKIKNIDLEVIDLTNIPPWTCVEQDRQRPQHEQVGSKVIWEKWYKYLAPKPYKGIQDGQTIICDLDGTVRDNTWRNAYDLTGKCIDDPPIWHVIHAVRGIQQGNNCEIDFFSGMEGSKANLSNTNTWLERYFTNFKLSMRLEGDHRRDSVVKSEMFQKCVADFGYGVVAVFDDRPQVIRECWVPLGLYDRVFSVGKFGLEF